METVAPHVLLFPIPLLGHITPALKLAEVLSLRGLLVSFLTTEHVCRRIFGDDDGRRNDRRSFSVLSIPDGLPDDHPRSTGQSMDVLNSLSENSREAFRDLLVPFGKTSKPATCAIVDGLMPFTAEVAEELGVPVILFRTSGPCSFWAYFFIPKLIEAGEIPFPEGCDMDELVRRVPGMESFLRRRDLPKVCRVKDVNDPILQAMSSATQRTTRAKGLIFNSAEELDAALLSKIRSFCPVTYAVGPLDSLLGALDRASARPSWWGEDRTSVYWLDSQPPKSVVYVSFGSMAVLSRTQMLEFWHGLVSSGYRFLWVVRPDLLEETGGAADVPAELAAATREKGCLVDWVNQPEILAHEAVGAFLTHSGWNSALEGISAGVPMICWPFFFDQMINSRFISEVWKIGLDMKDTCERETVARTVKTAMEGESAEELRRNVTRLREMMKQSVEEGGSSRLHLEKLVQDIRAMSCVEILGIGPFIY